MKMHLQRMPEFRHIFYPNKIFPASRQGAIIIFGVIGLFDASECLHLWKVSKFDW